MEEKTAAAPREELPLRLEELLLDAVDRAGQEIARCRQTE